MKKSIFLNISNHPSSNWPKEQKEEALKFGEIVDYPFPNVSPYISAEEILQLADKIYSEVRDMSPSCVMCSGEFTLCYSIVKRLRTDGFKVVAACTERIAREYIDKSGTIKKESAFCFVRFREFE